MKILHVYSDWKWTGPAEPALQACQALQQRGHEVLFAYRTPQHEADESIRMKAVAMGVNGTEKFALDRYLHPGGTLHDLFTLPFFLKKERFDIVHTHLCHDHAVAGICARLAPGHGPAVVRSLYRRTVLKPTAGYRFQLRRLTDGWLTFTDTFRERYISRFNLPPDRVAVAPMTVDLDRFSPDRRYRDMRQEFGIERDAPVIGIVGRFQKYRRMDVFLEAASRLLNEIPGARFLVIGRSSKIKETVVEPAKRLGIQDKVILTGYRIDDYVDIINCLDIFSLLMPGFDGTARAVREALAMGKPCVVPDYGMLPGIVRDGMTGTVVKRDDAAALAQGWSELIRNRQRLQEMGAKARSDAEERFRIDLLGPVLERFYCSLLLSRTKHAGNESAESDVS